MQEDSHLTEDALRQALSRLGAGSERSSRYKDPVRDDKPSSSIRHNESARVTTPFGRKRRFSSDQHVIVERSSQGRKAQGRQYSRDSRSPIMVDEQSDLERLRNELREEKRHCRDAQAEAESLKQRMQSLETRLAHYRIQADEQRKACDAQKEETLLLKAELHRAREHKKTPVRRQSSKRAKETASARVPQQVDEQEPVQWWKD